METKKHSSLFFRMFFFLIGMFSINIRTKQKKSCFNVHDRERIKEIKRLYFVCFLVLCLSKFFQKTIKLNYYKHKIQNNETSYIAT